MDMVEKTAVQFGQALYHLRMAEGRSRHDVVQNNNISLNALSSIENGQALIKLDTLTMLLTYYGVSMEDFAANYVDRSNIDFGNRFEALISDDTRFFILDTKGQNKDNNYEDQDFVAYHWNAHQFNRMRVGDWFIYRRPTVASETKQWYLFGYGRIATITDMGEGNLHATIDEGHLFPQYLLADPDLTDFPWTFHQRTRADWQHFFNQYGMNSINQTDFEALLALAYAHYPDQDFTDVNLVQEEAAIYKQISQGQFEVSETESLQKQRLGQQILAERVKEAYGYRCAVTGINTREFLVASHIIPWKDNTQKRLDPGNVICLSTLWDRAFDQGFITIRATDDRILFSPRISQDPALQRSLSEFEGARLHAPKKYQPEREALEYHNDTIFLSK